MIDDPDSVRIQTKTNFFKIVTFNFKPSSEVNCFFSYSYFQTIIISPITLLHKICTSRELSLSESSSTIHEHRRVQLISEHPRVQQLPKHQRVRSLIQHRRVCLLSRNIVEYDRSESTVSRVQLPPEYRRELLQPEHQRVRSMNTEEYNITLRAQKSAWAPSTLYNSMPISIIIT